MLMRTLTAIGHTCEEAEDGQIAVDMVKEKGITAFDAILMDFVMVRPLPQPPQTLYYLCLFLISLLCYLFPAGDGWPGRDQSHSITEFHASDHWVYGQYLGF